MRTVASTASLFVALVVTPGCFSSSHRSQSSPRPGGVAVARVAPPATTAPAAQPPVGALGLPMGTVARVRALVVSGRDLRDKGHQGEFLLRVTHVNRRELDDKPLCEFGVPAFLRKNLAQTYFELYELKRGKQARELTDRQEDALERGYVGKEFILDAYETGGFSGIPRNMPDDVPLWQDRGFGFRTSLVVVAER
jgi:hypothetical protein